MKRILICLVSIIFLSVVAFELYFTYSVITATKKRHMLVDEKPKEALIFLQEKYGCEFEIKNVSYYEVLSMYVYSKQDPYELFQVLYDEHSERFLDSYLTTFLENEIKNHIENFVYKKYSMDVKYVSCSASFNGDIYEINEQLYRYFKKSGYILRCNDIEYSESTVHINLFIQMQENTNCEDILNDVVKEYADPYKLDSIYIVAADENNHKYYFNWENVQ